MDTREYQTVILGALLHDIGKLLQRGSTDLVAQAEIQGKHPHVGSVFASAMQDVYGQVADPVLLRTLVQRHHENERAFPPDQLVFALPAGSPERVLAALVSLADNLSSKERGDRSEQTGDEGFRQKPVIFRLKPLSSVFGSLGRDEVPGSPAEQPQSLRFHPKPLVPTGPAEDGEASLKDVILPKAFGQFEEREMDALLKAFGAEFSKRFRNDGSKVDLSKFDVVLTHTLSLLQQFAWCIPANTQEDEPDVSLYDHLRTTAAIAACLYRYHESQGHVTPEKISSGESERLVRPDRPGGGPAAERFLLVLGDLSGIQRYIFGITSTGAGGGVAKRLRARSLYVQMLSEVACLQILRRAGLPYCNALMASGGKFYLLLPNTENVRAILATFQQEADKWFLDNLRGEITLNLAHVPGGDSRFDAGAANDAGGFSYWAKAVNDAAGHAKVQPLTGALAAHGRWNERAFLQQWPAAHYACRSCTLFPTPKEEGVCEQCQRDKKLGQRITQRDFLAFFDDPTAGEVSILGWSVSAEVTGERPVHILRLNSPDLGAYRRFPATFRFLANRVPLVGDLEEWVPGPDGESRDDRSVADFTQIAGQSQGRALLGYLKMDVDNLGRLFAFGLRREGNEPNRRSKDTISRQATLSRMLDWFFCGWVQHLLETEFRTCYAVFSGGDDLFIVGPWDAILRLAGRVHEDFTAYTGRKDVTISAGLLLAKPGYPIARAQADVEHVLDQAKGAGKDRIAILGDVLAWEEWRRVSVRREQLDGWVGDAGVSTAFLYSLMEYGRMWQRYIAWRKSPGDNPAGVLGLRFQPLLAYNLRRNLGGDAAAGLRRWAEAFTVPQPFRGEQEEELNHLALLAQLQIQVS